MRSIILAAFAVAALQAQSSPAPVISSTAVGHQYRQDDLPALAAAPDGSLWCAWLSFDGAADTIGLRRYSAGVWSNIHWVPNTSGDTWLPQVAVDRANRVWVVWSQQVDGNWDLYARYFDAAAQQWGDLQRLTTDPLPDINPRLASDQHGRFALVWQGFRARNSNIFLRTFDGERWQPAQRITNHPANDWSPAVALDSAGSPWIVYDSYRNGNYDVYLSHAGREVVVASTPAFEARATVAVDGSDRVWVAWEEGSPGWGKDQGYIVRDRKTGSTLGGFRQARVRSMSPAPGPVLTPFQSDRAFAPHIFARGADVWVAANLRHTTLQGRRNPPEFYFPNPQKGYWEWTLTRLPPQTAVGGGENRWTEPAPLPHARGRQSERINAAWDTSGQLWLAWPTDNRESGDYHRPIRQQVYAGAVVPSAAPRIIEIAPQPSPIPAPPPTTESADLQAIRSYTAQISGRPQHILRGDFHRHTELSWDRGGEPDGSLEDFYRYMIDAAGMDFGANTDHQGGAWPYWWWYIQKMTDMYHVPGAYVPIFGYERSAQWPFGHRNIFFARRTDARVTPFFLKEGVRAYQFPLGAEGDEPGSGSPDLVSNDQRLLYEEVRAHHGLAIAHTTSTNQGGRWTDNDPALEPVVEIFQGARTSSEQAGGPLVADPQKDVEQMTLIGQHLEGMVSVAWAKGYKLGVIASSDHFSTHISYAMVYTADPTRQGILDAIRRRHTYGATDNIILDVRMGSHFMGDEFDLAAPAPIKVKVQGTKPIAWIEILKDSKVIYSIRPNQRQADFEFIDKAASPGRHYYYVRLQQEDRMTAWSSPFFVNSTRE